MSIKASISHGLLAKVVAVVVDHGGDYVKQ
jgi:hypothetical protein